MSESAGNSERTVDLQAIAERLDSFEEKLSTATALLQDIHSSTRGDLTLLRNEVGSLRAEIRRLSGD